MNVQQFLTSLSDMLKEKAGIELAVVEDHVFPGGYYMSFSQFNTAVLRVNKDGKFNVRGVEVDANGVFSYPWKYRFLIPTDETITRLHEKFPQVTFDPDKESSKAVFPVFCYLNVLYQFYHKKLSGKSAWYDRYSNIERWKFEKIRSTIASLPSRGVLSLLSKEDQAKCISPDSTTVPDDIPEA